MMRYLTEAKDQCEFAMIKPVKLTVNVLSLLGGVFVLVMIASNTQLRSFSFYLIINLALSGVLCQVGNFLILDTSNYQSGDILCLTQGMLTGIMETSQCFWQTIISYSLLVNINRYEGAVIYLQRQILVINLFCYGLPIGLYLGLMANDYMGVSDQFTCWIKTDKMAIGLIVFYLPLYLCMAYSLFVYIVLWNKLKNISNLSSYPDINLLKNYPLVILIAYITGSVYRVLGVAGVPCQDTGVLQVIHTGLSGLLGFMNCLIFVMQPVVRVKIKSIYHNVFRRKGGAGKSTQAMKNLSRPNYQAKLKDNSHAKEWIVINKQDHPEIHQDQVEVQMQESVPVRE